MMLKLTRKVSLFARNHKIHPNKPPILYPNLIGMPEPRIKPKWTSEFLERFSHRKMEIQNFWYPYKHRRGFKIYDAHRSTGGYSVFLTPSTTQERIQNFWSPQGHSKKFRISDPPNNTGKNSEFLIPPITQAKLQNFWSPQEQSIKNKAQGWRDRDSLELWSRIKWWPEKILAWSRNFTLDISDTSACSAPPIVL